MFLRQHFTLRPWTYLFVCLLFWPWTHFIAQVDPKDCYLKFFGFALPSAGFTRMHHNAQPDYIILKLWIFKFFFCKLKKKVEQWLCFGNKFPYMSFLWITISFKPRIMGLNHFKFFLFVINLINFFFNILLKNKLHCIYNRGSI